MSCFDLPQSKAKSTLCIAIYAHINIFKNAVFLLLYMKWKSSKFGILTKIPWTDGVIERVCFVCVTLNLLFHFVSLDHGTSENSKVSFRISCSLYTYILKMNNTSPSRRRKFTDKSLPSSVLHSAEFTDSKFYQQLLDMERKLDWTMSRKRTEIQDALGKPAFVRTRAPLWFDSVSWLAYYRQPGHYACFSVTPFQTKHGRIWGRMNLQTSKLARVYHHGHSK